MQDLYHLEVSLPLVQSMWRQF